MTRDDILDHFDDEELLFIDGFDDAIIGIDTVSFRVVYSEEIMVEVLIAQGMSYDDALEHFVFNIKRTEVGDKTPIYCKTMAL